MSDLSIFRGTPYPINRFINVHCITIGEIEEVGENLYNTFLSNVLFNKSLLADGNPEVMSMDDYKLLLALVSESPEFKEIFLQSLSFFIKQEVHFNLEGGFFYVVAEDETVPITEEDLIYIRDIIKKQNFVDDKAMDKKKPANSKAQELLERMRKAKEKIAKRQQEKDKKKTLSLLDITEIVACYAENLDPFKVWDLTVYQLYMSFIRLQMKDTYETNRLMLPHAASEDFAKDFQESHWASKINT
ncbi:hypothetical protein BEH_07220 [Priestia filamentosa]|uniref:Uncharacterized protein n=1 Tax=Priestia filamentosa TaxID=1402861 RepID=A0A0H4KE50_9BACI|nr:hypothetical protein [Priestia filamentosa]AKO91910.1 hypothetical protein BEH_07220 [Priestia filamentosa]